MKIAYNFSMAARRNFKYSKKYVEVGNDHILFQIISFTAQYRQNPCNSIACTTWLLFVMHQIIYLKTKDVVVGSVRQTKTVCICCVYIYNMHDFLSIIFMKFSSSTDIIIIFYIAIPQLNHVESECVRASKSIAKN